MRQELISTQEPSPALPSSPAGLHRRLLPLLFYIFLTITAVAVFIPLNPRMPSSGLDASWQFAMNEAVARHVDFGDGVMFTYGPYASICTRTYHPATDLRMMWGSLLIAVSYGTALLFMARGGKRYLLLVLSLFLATFGSTELLLSSYSCLLVVCVLKQIDSDDSGKPKVLPWLKTLAVVVMWSALGLLPVVKGSLLLPFAVSVVIPPFLLAHRARFKQAFALLFIPVVAAVGFWSIAGQSLARIPTFLRGTLALTSGYTEAMSTPWVVLPSVVGDGLVLVFLAISALIFLSIFRSTRMPAASKWMLALLCAAFLLVSFKHGFVPASAVTSAYSSLVVLVLIIAFLHNDKYIAWSLSIAMVLAVVTSVTRDSVLLNEVHARFGVGAAESGAKQSEILAFCAERALASYARTTYVSAWNTYSGAWNGLLSRVSRTNSLEERFNGARESIRNAYTLPALNGTADMYEDEQSILLASGNQWNPRPVIQSYSAYTPDLARLNEQHLRGSNAPDWVFFELQSIDGRLPSLDDGLSWPALLDNYAFDSYDGRFILMRKKQSFRSASTYDTVYKTTCKTGAIIAIPETEGPLFAEVDLKPTLAGRMLITLFNPPQLAITTHLANGDTKRYRVVSEMMTTGFLISPLVTNTGEFASLVAGTGHSQHEDKVDSVSITPSYGGSLFWSATYDLTLKRYKGN